jgi:outer membrane protein TolC
LFTALLFLALPAAAQPLDEVIARALAHSPELRALEAGVAEARAGAALGNPFSPSASVSTTPGYATGLPIAVLGQVPAIGTVEAHRLLYDSSARAEQLGLTSQVDAAVARLESRKRDVAQNVAELYARFGAGTVLVTSARRRVAALETIAARTEALRAEGRIRELDVDRAALQVAGAKRAALQAQSRLELDQLRLTAITGGPVIASTAAMPPLPPSQSGAIDPELRGLDARIAALQHASSLANHFFQPTVAAQIQYSRLFDRYRRFYLNFKPDDFSVGATVSLPLWTGGHRAAASERIAAQLQQLIAQRDGRRMELELTMREAEADVVQANAERELASRTHDVAEKALRVAEELSREGRGEANDVPLAQVALADADDDVANASAHVLAAVAKLRIARGELPDR